MWKTGMLTVACTASSPEEPQAAHIQKIVIVIT
jgi:hypothetical protein